MILTAATEIKKNIKPGFCLEQNDPNPFKKRTIIKINLPHRTRMTVIITNTYGKVIDKMIENTKDAGTYELEFIAEELPFGTYFCHVVADSFCESKEMELTK
ncbi:MAG: hypothetical protein HND39_02105 [Ignavibacteriota bacterium]|nr:MAG: hypothetical protein EDM72_09675 [Chlorobiota bacterium]MBE7477233.1 hypothetical protein [Ignavibacteriales bacterium]MBL1122618.1 hypothetical protein [Ignavibacteriota bacterium]MBV6419081.1 hypothetical protein [Ignavibacteriaceae bacterium]MCE7856302.1 hypothetical protein [Ignavibacteria bacterium CHB3]MEB2297436.1 hypothetical protein [Ignavibacteria bacterium]